MDVGAAHPQAWQSIDEMADLCGKLNALYHQYGTPELPEVTAPFKTADFDSEAFLACCASLEKKMKRFAPMKVALLNGSANQRARPQNCLVTVEDILEMKGKMREKRIHLRFSIDLPILLTNRRHTRYSDKDAIMALGPIKNSIVCVSLSKVSTTARNGMRYVHSNGNSDHNYLDRYGYPQYNDIYTWLSAVLNDNQQRFFIPKGVSSEQQLETLVDDMLRAGFSFCGGESQNG